MPRDGSGIYTKPYPNVVSGTTIESTVHNGTVSDIETDLNAPRPIISGGTGASNATQARDNLDVERSMQQVTNYDSHVWEPGSFWSFVDATSPPIVGHSFHGTVYGTDQNNLVIQARDYSDSVQPGRVYVREKKAGVWTSGWNLEGSSSYVELAGDTMTGPLNIATADAGVSLTIGSGGGGRLQITPDAGAGVGTKFTANTGNGVTYEVVPFGIQRWSNGGVGQMSLNNGGILQILSADSAIGLKVGAAGDGRLQVTGDAGANVGTKIFANTGNGITYDVPLGANQRWANNSVVKMTLNQFGDIMISGTGLRPGGGPWADSSDERIKNIIGDYQNGLDAVISLHPVKYTFKGNDTPVLPIASKDGATVVPYENSPHHAAAIDTKEFIGLIAQECEAAFPEMVTQHAGWIDGQSVTDMRSLDTTPLIFALVNAVKTLAARIEALEETTEP